MLTLIWTFKDLTMNLPTYLIATLLITMPFSVISATYYKSVDDKGNVQYTQTKPRETQTERIKVDAHAPDNTSTYKRPTLNSAKKETGENADKADKAASKDDAGSETESKLTAKQKQQACASERARLAQLKSSSRVRQRNDKGETRYLTDNEKMASIKSSQQSINKHCN